MSYEKAWNRGRRFGGPAPLSLVRGRAAAAAPSARAVFGSRAPRRRYRAPMESGLGLSLKPPKWARRFASRVIAPAAAVAASTLIPGGGLIFGSRRAPRFLRAPKSVRPFLRTAAKVQLAAGAAIATGMLAPQLAPAIFKFGAGLFKGQAPTTSGDTSPTRPGDPYFPAPTEDGGGGGGGGGGEPPMEQAPPPMEAETPEPEGEPGAKAPARAGVPFPLILAGLVLAGIAASKLGRRRRAA